MNPAIKQHLLTAPTTQVDPSLHHLIEKWSDSPKSFIEYVNEGTVTDKIQSDLKKNRFGCSLRNYLLEDL